MHMTFATTDVVPHACPDSLRLQKADVLCLSSTLPERVQARSDFGRMVSPLTFGAARVGLATVTQGGLGRAQSAD
ncbi:hypothetical protein Scani_39670 [Streptomyces caniferus]|uniref:Uncharacterized protein n=1 Tax=Streptomyces caniferus TaxID=285557 RepID=A0A640S8X3_9ACTN|nr:hypothetical protein Scani_39670 [Streptomyces caniferus]